MPEKPHLPSRTAPEPPAGGADGTAGRPAKVARRGNLPARPGTRPSSLSRARALLPAAALALVLSLATPPPATAQFPVTDQIHIALNAYWHYVHYVQFAFQIYQHFTQIENQIRQIDNQLRALAKLQNPNWREIQTLLSELDSLMRSGSALGYSISNPGYEFRQVFPGWTPWTVSGAPELQSERALDTLRAGLAATNQQSQSFAPGEDLLARIRQQMTTTDGHQQALEQLATLSAFSAQEQLLTRQSLAVANNQAAVAQGYWLNRQAQGDASFAVVMTETSLAAHQTTSPGWTFRPAWQPLP